MCRVLATGDFNNDRNVDLLVQSLPQPDEPVWVLPGRGNGTFGPGDMSKFAAMPASRPGRCVCSVTGRRA